MVEFVDGSVLAQLGHSDMRLPIQYAVTWPERIENVSPPVDFTKAHTWTFEPLDEEVFKAVKIARQVGSAGLTYPAVYNAANEQAVDAFHDKSISFPEILEIIEEVVVSHKPELEMTLETVLAAEVWARDTANRLIANRN
jgi:1-deoxy-D-xylulose-5-phosphate reductoisomerase